MHPAPSVIFFSSLSGFGFGLMFWLGLGLPAATGWSAFGYYFVAYGLAVGGLLFSALHLANPKNAHKAFSQWRTSWLSREAWAAVIALLAVAMHAIGVIFLGARMTIIGAIGSGLALFTVLTTSMIYMQIRAVPRWNQVATPILFLTLSLAGGALLAGQFTAAVVLLLLAGIAQLAHWHLGDVRADAPDSTPETATGLGSVGRVRLFEPPHTGSNYLLHEMVYRIGRRHALRLRVIAIALMVVVPALLLILLSGPLFLAIAALSHLSGVLASRWLFFAEAEHAVSLYYGRR